MYPQSRLGKERPLTNLALVWVVIISNLQRNILMRFHMNFELAFFFKGHPTLIALAWLMTTRLYTVFLLVFPTSLCSIAQRAMHNSKMYKKTPPQLEDLGTNVANKPMVIVHHF